MRIQFVKNKNLDYALIILDIVVPTKQDKFKKIYEEVFILEDNTTKLIKEDIYIKVPDGLNEFRERLQKAIKETSNDLYFPSEKLEIILGITAKEKRLKIVDAVH